ncbi:MAG: chaperone modulator CbpM [Methylovulum sp.]|nr:chaperone modulator CbpM [Methylovulum sp.]
MNSNNLFLVHTGTIIEDDYLTLEQLCNACSVHADWLINLVEEGIIEPDGKESATWRFSGACLVRVRSALNLERDLGVNMAGIALALDLLEELDRLRTQLKTSRHA